MNDENLPAKSEFLVYEAEDGTVKIDVRLENETVWLTQQLMAELFQSSKQNVGQHLKRIFAEGELEEDSVVKKFFTTAADGKKYRINFYSLDAIISVGYRVKSRVATRFRIWATQRLRKDIVKGFVLLDWWPKRKTNDHAWKVSAKEILKSGCNLDRKTPNGKEELRICRPSSWPTVFSRRKRGLRS